MFQILFFLLLTSVFSFGQNSQLEKYNKAEDFLKTNEIQNAYEIFNHNNQEVHTKMCTELWKRQKEDTSLTQYLQNQKPIFSLENGNFLAVLS